MKHWNLSREQSTLNVLQKGCATRIYRTFSFNFIECKFYISAHRHHNKMYTSLWAITSAGDLQMMTDHFVLKIHFYVQT